MNREIVFLVKQTPQGGYTARALGYQIAMEIDAAENLHQQLRAAVQCYFQETDPPHAIHLHFLRNEVIAV